MTATVELSLYPLCDDYPTHVISFLEKLKTISGVEMHTNGMSTILIGEYAALWTSLGRLIEEEMSGGSSLFVMKVAPGRREYM